MSVKPHGGTELAPVQMIKMSKGDSLLLVSDKIIHNNLLACNFIVTCTHTPQYSIIFLQLYSAYHGKVFDPLHVPK